MAPMWIGPFSPCNYWTENDMSKLLSTGSCSLHAIHGAFKTGEQSIDWKLKQVLRARHQILHDSPARWNYYADITGSSRFPLPFCGTWIEDEKVVVQAIEIWDDICQLCTFWQSPPKNKWLSSQSYLMLLSAVKDPLGKITFLFVYSWYHETISYGKYTKPMMPFMYDDHQLLRDIGPKYIKPETLEKCKNASILCDVNFSDAKHHLRNKEVDIRFGAKKILTNKMKTD